MLICSNCGEENPAKFRMCGFCGQGGELLVARVLELSGATSNPVPAQP